MQKTPVTLSAMKIMYYLDIANIYSWILIIGLSKNLYFILNLLTSWENSDNIAFMKSKGARD